MNIEASKVLDTVMAAEDRLGYIFEPEEVTRTVNHTIRKCQQNGKDEAYFYKLLGNELSDCLMRKRINYYGTQNQMRREASAI